MSSNDGQACFHDFGLSLEGKLPAILVNGCRLARILRDLLFLMIPHEVPSSPHAKFCAVSELKDWQHLV